MPASPALARRGDGTATATSSLCSPRRATSIGGDAYLPWRPRHIGPTYATQDSTSSPALGCAALYVVGRRCQGAAPRYASRAPSRALEDAAQRARCRAASKRIAAAAAETF